VFGGGGGGSGGGTASTSLNPRGKEYGPSYGVGDVVGCGVVFAR